MNDTTKIPEEFVPFKEMDICSNTLKNCSTPIIIDNSPIILIGNNDMPSIWLMRLDRNKKWFYVVNNNISSDPAVKVKKRSNYLSVYFNDQLLVNIIKIAADSVVITHIDLRPFGLAIFGDVLGLNVGGANMSGNSFDNIGAMVKIG